MDVKQIQIIQTKGKSKITQNAELRGKIQNGKSLFKR